MAQSEIPLSEYEEEDESHGRCVIRRVRVFKAPPEAQAQWQGLEAFVAVERCGVREGKPFKRQSWFIVSQVIDAEEAAGLIRAHRGSIENKVHWVKDVIQGEDGSLIRAPQPATMMALMRSWAMTAFRKAGFDSLSKAMRLFKHDLLKLISFL